MASITLRNTKGSPLTNTEIDANFTNLNNDKLETNGSGANLTNLNASNIASGTVAVARGGTGQTTYTNGQLLIGNTTGNTLSKATLTAGTNIGITNGGGSITIATIATPSFTTVTTSGAATIGGDYLAVNGGNITTTSTGTATVFNANATTLNIGQAATTVSVGATTGTLTVRNATLAAKAITASTTLGVSGNATIGGTLSVTGLITGSISGNAGTVTNGVYTTGNQTIGGTKTFSNTISGSISGNAGTVTNGVYTTGNQTIGGNKTFTGSTTLDATTVSGIITHGSAQMVAPTGSAPLYAARAWGTFDGDSSTFGSSIYANYSQSGTTVTVNTVNFSGTSTDHGFDVGDYFYIDHVSGTAVDGWYVVASVPSSTSFTYTAYTSLTTANTVGSYSTLPRRSLASGGNVKPFISCNSIANAANNGGVYGINFITSLPTNYAVSATGNYANRTLSQLTTTPSDGGANSCYFSIQAASTKAFLLIGILGGTNNSRNCNLVSFAVNR